MSALVSYYDKDGGTVITAKTLTQILAGATGTAQKFGVRNVGTRALGLASTMPAAQLAIAAIAGGDGSTRLRIKKDTATLSPPWNLAGVLGAPADGGIWGATGVYGWRLTATNATGETIGSLEVTVNVDVTTKRVTLTWTQVTGATGYKLYRTATPGTYGATTLRTTIGSGATTTFVDDGSATSSGTPPSTNTTGGVGPNYGTPPAGLDTSTAPFTIGQSDGTLAIGEAAYFWVNRVVPSSSAPAGNPRSANIALTEG